MHTETHRPRTAAELAEELKRIRALAEQDIRDLNSGRERASLVRCDVWLWRGAAAALLTGAQIIIAVGTRDESMTWRVVWVLIAYSAIRLAVEALRQSHSDSSSETGSP